jgi:bleomycin hydrolase
VVPKSIFPESYSSSASSRLNQLVTTKLREHALLLRASASSLRASPDLAHLSPAEREEKHVLPALRKQKEGYMGEIYKILIVTLGEPPKPDDKFTWEYYTAKGEYKKWQGTSLEFFKVGLAFV